MYSVLVSIVRPDEAGVDVIRWQRSWVGSYTARQLHVIWSLADQCAEAFLDGWAEAN